MAQASKAVRPRRRKLSLSKAQAEKEEAEEREGLVAQRQALQKKHFLKKLSDNYGIISITAKEVGLTSRTIERWRRADPDFNEACMEELMVQRGLVEGKLLQLINAGDTTAIRFYLRCKGRNSHIVPDTWIETVMVQGDPEQPLYTKVGLDEETRESIKDGALATAMAKAMRSTPDVFKEVKDSGKKKST